MVGGQRIAVLLFVGIVLDRHRLWSDGVFWRVAQLEKSAGDGAGGVHCDSHGVSDDDRRTGTALRAGMFSGRVRARGAAVGEKAERACGGVVDSLSKDAKARLLPS